MDSLSPTCFPWVISLNRAVTGRFITEDPAKDGLNWYSYCGGNPVNFVDPWGLFTEGDNLYVGGSNDKNDVKVLQNELKWLGLYSGEIDGSYGPATKKAVENYQSIMGLKVDGITGNNTWKSLGLLFLTKADENKGVRVKTIDLKQYFDVTVPVGNALGLATLEAQR